MNSTENNPPGGNSFIQEKIHCIKCGNKWLFIPSTDIVYLISNNEESQICTTHSSHKLDMPLHNLFPLDDSNTWISASDRLFVNPRQLVHFRILDNQKGELKFRNAASLLICEEETIAFAQKLSAMQLLRN